uniref:Glucose-repressible alcohol dehydrogenase transcriptional effector-like n=1 Tax=Dermatophagoides pteronyssinus TaxID=6956 RepID=A0A6P6YIW8_DERPT
QQQQQRAHAGHSGRRLRAAPVLGWNFRRDRILSEIVAYNPDIICLQEVQGDHFEEFFAPALLRRGYEGLYKRKTTKLFRGGASSSRSTSSARSASSSRTSAASPSSCSSTSKKTRNSRSASRSSGSNSTSTANSRS